MKILYIVPSISLAGGIARVLSLKANYFAEKWEYEIHILTQNSGNSEPFYFLNKKIILHDIKYSTRKFRFLFQFKNRVTKKVKEINPDIIVVSDNGLKAFLIPFLLSVKQPVIFEAHSSRYNSEKNLTGNIFSLLKGKIIDIIRTTGAKKFHSFVALSEKSCAEWKVTKCRVIPNPLWMTTEKTADLGTNTVLCVSRHSYEKGLDRLLKIWQKTVELRPNWNLDIYGEEQQGADLLQIARQLGIEKNVRFFPPVQDITEKYLTASVYVMTSRFEAFPMVLIEAMNCGLPVVVYDCPVGPSVLIKNNENGFLIEDGNEDQFVEKLITLLDDNHLRRKIGSEGKKSVKKYEMESIMKSWQDLFQSLVQK